MPQPLAPGAKPSRAWHEARAALRPRAIPSAPRPETAAAVALNALCPGSIVGVLFFGSQRTRANPDRFSAYDFLVVVEAYLPFYRALFAASRLRRGPTLVAALNAVLTPNQISLRLPDGRGGDLHAKCSVFSLEDLRRETSLRRGDHFALGRLFQPVELLWARDSAAGETLIDVLTGACVATYTWSRPWLTATFDADAYLRTLLRVSMGREIRPEPTGQRTDTLHEAQREEQLPVYGALLRGLREDGELVALPGDGATYSLAHPVGFWERLRLAAYFRVSLVRATLRWFKYVLTFDDWLDYLLRKVRRHTGQDVELTARERKHPLVFLWPKVIRYLRHKNDTASRTPGA